ncbi:MAG: hypothetical protein WBG86_18260 [Polyangiales bacterium]
MSTRGHRILLTLGAMVALSSACGDGGLDESEAVPREWKAGDTDPFGCPYVRVAAWEEPEAHSATCGAGCVPTRLDDDFVACISDAVSDPLRDDLSDSIFTPVSLKLIHPIDGTAYVFRSLEGAERFLLLCWREANSGLPFAPSAELPVPEECWLSPPSGLAGR